MLNYESDIANIGEPADAAEIIVRAHEMDEKSVFLEGLSEWLNTLGVNCTPDGKELMLDEVKARYKSILGISCPRTVVEWVRGTVPSASNRRNNYELCMALEMDFERTADFFKRYFLTLPWGCKSRIDAVFLYCIYHRRPYTFAVKMLEESKGFVPQENAQTATAQIFQTILSTDDDAAFLDYLSTHCYGNEQQFQTARAKIIEETELAKQHILDEDFDGKLTSERLNSSVIAALLNYRYQPDRESEFLHDLPKRYTESLPNDVTLGKILKGEKASYETLRKTLMLLKLYNFYTDALNDEESIQSNYSDFCAELNSDLDQCGFAPIYPGHPFDYIILGCANTLEPIVTLYDVNERN